MPKALRHRKCPITFRYPQGTRFSLSVMLNRLLNELDGLRERADVFFILTTNRPDTLEPALASRPGRIDQAIEFPLPDERLRRRLITLYARTLAVPPGLVDDLARRTDGASPAFIKEFLRRIAQHHLDSEATGDVTAATADAALHASDDLVRSAGGLEDMPLIALVQGRPIQDSKSADAGVRRGWVELQRELAARSRRGRVVLVPNSGHGIPVEAPEAVVAAVKEIVTTVRSGVH